MNTLTRSPVAPLLNRLFDEASALSPRSNPDMAELSQEELERLMRSKTEYLDFYGRLKDFPLAVSKETGASKVAQARDNLKAGGLLDLVEIREGDALRTLGRDLPESIDLVLLDGAKALYPEILSLVESRLRPGALIIADNADYAPEYLARVRSPAQGYMSIPFAEDVELSMRLG
jgi:predicted O-methyltransferase YrrM